MPFAEYLAREAIRDTLSRYAMAVESGNFEALRDIFHPDAQLVIQNGKRVPPFATAASSAITLRRH